MRKFIIPLLLASVAATPTLAAPRDRDNDDDTRTERQQSREDRQQVREERQQSREDRQVRVERAEPAAQVQGDRTIVRRDVEAVREARREARDSASEQRANRVQVREDRRDLRDSQRALRQAERPVPPVLRTPVPVVSDTPREGTQPPPRTEVRHSAPVHWNTNWRKNSRYNWYNWRSRHRSLFTLGAYYDPFGWGYRPYSIGWRMWPSYYRSSFWLNDPWEYRLPYAPPGTRWIRYYDDAILVDTWSGQVVDVIYNFFW